MNRLVQAGIGFGLTAGAVLFPTPAGAEGPHLQNRNLEQIDGCNGPEVMYTQFAANTICKTGEKVAEVLTPDVASPLPPGSVDYGEAGQDRSDYFGPLALLAGITALVGVGTHKLHKHIAEQKSFLRMHEDVEIYENMNLEMFNFVAESYLKASKKTEE
jgi:hypothetical protein